MALRAELASPLRIWYGGSGLLQDNYSSSLRGLHCAGGCRVPHFVHSLIVATVAVILATSVSQAADVIRVAYAGSMGVVMDRFIGPAFA